MALLAPLCHATAIQLCIGGLSYSVVLCSLHSIAYREQERHEREKDKRERAGVLWIDYFFLHFLLSISNASPPLYSHPQFSQSAFPSLPSPDSSRVALIFCLHGDIAVLSCKCCNLSPDSSGVTLILCLYEPLLPSPDSNRMSMVLCLYGGIAVLLAV